MTAAGLGDDLSEEGKSVLVFLHVVGACILLGGYIVIALVNYYSTRDNNDPLVGGQDNSASYLANQPWSRPVKILVHVSNLSQILTGALLWVHEDSEHGSDSSKLVVIFLCFSCYVCNRLSKASMAILVRSGPVRSVFLLPG